MLVHLGVSAFKSLSNSAAMLSEIARKKDQRRIFELMKNSVEKYPPYSAISIQERVDAFELTIKTNGQEGRINPFSGSFFEPFKKRFHFFGDI